MAFGFKGAISFGMIYIPVRLSPAVRENDVGFHLIDKKTHSRVRYQKTIASDGERAVGKNDIVRGYEYEEGKYVIFSDEDFEKLKTRRDRNVTIERFVRAEEIDPVYFDRAYYAAPTGAEKAFALLVRAMEEEEKVGVARAVLGTKECLLALRAEKGRLLVTTLYFADEVQEAPTVAAAEVKDKELELAKTLIGSMTEPFRIEEYRDEYRDRVMEAIEKKIAGKEIAAVREEKETRVADLMQALEMSLKRAGAKGRAAASRSAAGNRAADRSAKAKKRTAK